ncbi:MAG: hypothetical protein M3N29_05425 [Chloroflexota bacterium]|nr:hypothetical protein [Chloroflexota bacterium]
MWRGRASGLARPPILTGAILALSVVSAAVLGVTFAGTPGRPAGDWLLVGRSEAGEILLRVPLPDSSFALRYRNSVYDSLAEERFRVDATGRLVLAELASDEVALLGEYYDVARRPRRAPLSDARDWVAPPARHTALEELPLIASQHGERALLVEGRRPVPLWSLAGTETATITLAAEKDR